MVAISRQQLSYKSLKTSSETNLPLIQAFKWSKNKFDEFAYPKG